MCVIKRKYDSEDCTEIDELTGWQNQNQIAEYVRKPKEYGDDTLEFTAALNSLSKAMCMEMKKNDDMATLKSAEVQNQKLHRYHLST